MQPWTSLATTLCVTPPIIRPVRPSRPIRTVAAIAGARSGHVGLGDRGTQAALVAFRGSRPTHSSERDAHAIAACHPWTNPVGGLHGPNRVMPDIPDTPGSFPIDGPRISTVAVSGENPGSYHLNLPGASLSFFLLRHAGGTR